MCPGPNGGTVAGGLGEVRRFFSQYDNLFPAASVEPVDLVAMRSEVVGAHQSYQAAGTTRSLPAFLDC